VRIAASCRRSTTGGKAADRSPSDAAAPHSLKGPGYDVLCASCVSSEDHEEFVQVLANTYFLAEGEDTGDYSTVLKASAPIGGMALVVACPLAVD
jgi:hypothetical protein